MVPGSYRANSVGLFTVSMAAGRPYFVLSDHCIVLEAVLFIARWTMFAYEYRGMNRDQLFLPITRPRITYRGPGCFLDDLARPRRLAWHNAMAK